MTLRWIIVAIVVGLVILYLVGKKKKPAPKEEKPEAPKSPSSPPEGPGL